MKTTFKRLQDVRFQIQITGFYPRNAQELLVFYSFSLAEKGCRNGDVSPVTRNNLVLAGRVYQMLYVGEWLSCIQACYDDPRCTSYNYGISAADNGLCELNDCGFQDWCEIDTKYLIYFPNFVFQEIRKCQVFPLFFPAIKD